MNVALDPTSARMDPNEGRLLTFLRHPGHKAWLVLSLRLQGNAGHPESTSNHVSKSFTVNSDKEITDDTWTNVVTLSGLPRLEWLASLVHASKVPQLAVIIMRP
jgi:hypothetical protein